MRVQHLKKKADSELKGGNHRSAWDLYQQALQDAQDRDTRLALYSNLALALTRGGRTEEARVMVSLCLPCIRACAQTRSWRCTATWPWL